MQRGGGGNHSKALKGAIGLEVRRALVAGLLRATRPWLRATRALSSRCDASDHVLDALVASFVARASALGLCEPIPDDDRDLATREGWIALPRPGTLAQLAPASPEA